MSGGWAGSNRRQELPPDWPQIRSRIIERDRGRCQWPDPDGRTRNTGGETICGIQGTDVDHRIPGNDHRDSNLQLLCRDHHARKSAAEGGNSYIPLHRPKARHPALG